MWSKIRKQSDGCWIWCGQIHTGGKYGRTSLNGRKVYAHRLMYEIYHGPIPDNLHIDHLCRNTLCVNPDHLEAVTQRENNIRARKAVTK
jgi:hypothetical protein